jgi:hypothetical protein
MEDFTTKHPADAAPEELTSGQRAARCFLPEMAELQNQRLCIHCRQPQSTEVRITWTQAGQREWNISGMCEPCFDRIFAEPKEED